jgi:hypothetical protein
MVHRDTGIWPRAARATRHARAAAVHSGRGLSRMRWVLGSRKWWHTASLKLISSNLSSGLRGNLKLFKKAPAAGLRPTGCDGGLGLRVGTISWVSHWHEALVVVLLHDEGKGTLELKTGVRLGRQLEGRGQSIKRAHSKRCCAPTPFVTTTMHSSPRRPASRGVHLSVTVSIGRKE